MWNCSYALHAVVIPSSCSMYKLVAPKDTKTPFTRAKNRHGTPNLLALCLNHFGMALPICTTQNKRFFSSWARFQFLTGTPSLHLLYSREMMDKELAVILHRILSVKCDLNRNRKSHLRFNKETDRHLGEIRKK